MTNCVTCNQVIDAGQHYIEVRRMPEPGEHYPNERSSGFSHWPHCPTVIVERDGHYYVRMQGTEAEMGPVEKYDAGRKVVPLRVPRTPRTEEEWDRWGKSRP